jgi:methionine-rich copper-binding protein CopC
MRRLRGAAAWLVLLWSTGALAHAHLTDSSPVDGSQLLEGPAALVLTFSESVQLTALSIQRGGATAQKLVPPEQVAARISVSLPKLAAGVYVVRWRTLGSDGHVVPGQIRFIIK